MQENKGKKELNFQVPDHQIFLIQTHPIHENEIFNTKKTFGKWPSLHIINGLPAARPALTVFLESFFWSKNEMTSLSCFIGNVTRPGSLLLSQPFERISNSTKVAF